MSYTEALTDVSLGIFDGAQFTSPTVEFRVLLTQPSADCVWLKDGRPVGGRRGKYSMTVKQSGLVHTMIVADIQSSDAGVYTIKLRRHDASPCYLVDKGSELNADVLIERLAVDRDLGGLL